MNIAFRTDATALIGTGHFMRCLTLADELKKHGGKVRFICRSLPAHLIDMLIAKGMECIPLNEYTTQEPMDELFHANWLGTTQSQDAKDTIHALANQSWDWMVVDHYALDERWESAVRVGCKKLMVIDDLADRVHDCDLLLDQNLVADMAHRYDGKTPAHCGRMLGPEYALLQPQYADLHPRVPPREGPVRRVLVFFGGADTDNLTGKAVAAFIRLGRADIVLDVVINPASPHAESLRQQASRCAQMVLHTGLPSLAPLMVQADLAIGACGATSWERCCLGLPALVITLAENQKPIAAQLDKLGLINWLGHKDQVDEARLALAMTNIFDVGPSPEWSEHCQQQVDGQGVERVVSILMLNSLTKLKARPVRLNDESLILQWANDPLVRENAFSIGPIDAATHRLWFRKRLRDLDNCRIFVVETQDGFPIGQVRFERPMDEWEIAYSLDARVRGRKLSRPLLQTAMIAFRATMNGVILFGRVKKSNAASCRIFESIGFESENAGGAEVVYRHLFRRGELDQPVHARIDIDLAVGWLPGGLGTRRK